MASSRPLFVALLLAAFAYVFQTHLYPMGYHRFGFFRPVRSINNDQCTRFENFDDACEDGWLHQPSGKLYLVCWPREDKFKWFPFQDPRLFDEQRAGKNEYVAILDTKGEQEGKVTRVKPLGFEGHDGQGSIILHAMGVFLGQDGLGNDDSLRLFLINHRVQENGRRIGDNATVELFETTLGGDTMTHVRTYVGPAIITPNNLVPAGPDSFYFTNDMHVKVGPTKPLNFFFPLASIGYCDASAGCRLAKEGLQYPNGLAGAKQYPSRQPDVLYQSSSSKEFVNVFHIEANNSLTLRDTIRTNYIMDNVNMLPDQSIVISAFPKTLPLAKVLTDPKVTVVGPSSVLHISKTAGDDAGKAPSYNVQTIFEDDGNVASVMTNSVVDTERNLLFLAGVVTPGILICKIPPL